VAKPVNRGSAKFLWARCQLLLLDLVRLGLTLMSGSQFSREKSGLLSCGAPVDVSFLSIPLRKGRKTA
jgi:hypothetical protein